MQSLLSRLYRIYAFSSDWTLFPFSIPMIRICMDIPSYH